LPEFRRPPLSKLGEKIVTGVALVLISLTAPRQRRGRALGPLRIRDMTPLHILRLDMTAGPRRGGRPESLGIEADLSYANTFVMSQNVRKLPFQARFRGR